MVGCAGKHPVPRAGCFFAFRILERPDSRFRESRLPETFVRFWMGELFTGSICNAHATGRTSGRSLDVHRIGNGVG